MDLKLITPSLKTNNPLDVFKRICSFNGLAENNGNRAHVRIGLSSGYTVEGIPIKMDPHGNTIFISLKNSISYINTNALVGIEILNPEVVLELLSDGDYFKIPQNEVPTNLSLKRALKSKSESLENLYGLELNSEILEKGLLTNAEKFQFEKFLSILQELTDHLTEDDLGKAALKSLKEIKIHSSERKIELQKEVNILNVGINFKKKFSVDFKDQLKVALESNL